MKISIPRATLKFDLKCQIYWQARRDLNPQHPDLESDALPLELLACIIQPFKHLIFSESNRPHCKKSDYKRGCSLGLFVHCMLSAKSAILAEFQLIRCCAFVFGCCIISSFAFITCKGNDYSHEQTPSAILLVPMHK